MDTEQAQVVQQHADEELLRFVNPPSTGKIDPADLVVLKGAGYLLNGGLTEAGLDRAEALKVPMRLLNIMVLGIDITVYDKDGNKFRLVKGSELHVTFGGETKQHRKYYEVFAGSKFPILVVFANSAHTFRQDRWPLLMYIEPRYLA